MTPNATYRLQLTRDFDFADAAALAPYLKGLAVSHVYLSPHLQAAPGSTHGYDVIDHTRVSDELGGAKAHADMLDAFASHGLSVVLDIVPNHMSIARAADNAWWWDVLENGPSSRWADYFDVDWVHADERIRNKVLLPVLSDHYGCVLDDGKICVVRDNERIVIRVNDQIYPIGPRSVGWLLRPVAERVKNETLAFIADVLEELPSPTDLEQRTRRHRDKAAINVLLARLISEEAGIAAGIDDHLARISASAGTLDELLERQNYRLAYWRSARFDLDYRRFFDINELVGLRMNEAKVFADTHALPLQWLRDGKVTGLRVDHPDGLLDPDTYFERLRSHAPGAWIVAEKILERDEQLPTRWPIQGTTGYDFSVRVSGLWIDRAAEPTFNALFTTITGAESPAFAPVAAAKKRYIVREVLGADVRRITEHFVAVCEHQRAYRDTTRDELRSVIEAVLIALPVYRTYVGAAQGCSADDRAIIEQATIRARAQRPDIDARLFELTRDVLTGTLSGALETAAMQRFQQASGPIMAKGVEDTAFYAHQRFIALNDVGGDPDHFGTSVRELHAYNSQKQTNWPVAMLTTSTHDSKRSEDVRARLAVLTEIPGEWAKTVERWHAGANVDGDIAYHIYQTVVGAWPITPERLATYLEKAMREAKLHTSWTQVNAEYERGVQDFARQLLASADIAGFVQRVQRAGEENALAQKLIALTAPGVPDLYQGSELWDLRLTDPDNRRPVDFATRQKIAGAAAKADIKNVLTNWHTGMPKLWLTAKVLATRQQFPECFNETATYTPLMPDDERLIAYVRGSKTSERRVCAITWRLRLTPYDPPILLPKGTWRSILSSATHEGSVRLSTLTQGLPVALLTSAG